MPSSKKNILNYLLLTIIAGTFWTISRYPALHGKAGMLGEAPTFDILTLRPFIKYGLTDPYLSKVLKTTVNWYESNWRGMVFGLVVSALLMSIAKDLKLKKASSNSLIESIKNYLLGIFIGSPLGLCVNCAAPVASTLYKTAGSLPLALNVLFTSPTLNVVILGMIFTIFPIDIIIPKIFFTLLLVGLGVPALNYFGTKQKQSTTTECNSINDEIKETQTWLLASRDVVMQFLKNLYLVVISAVPLMLLAGLLAALIIHSIPLEYIISFNSFNFTTVLIVSIIATLLPLPIAVNILVAQNLYTMGFHPGLVSVLLFTLGSYSIYAMFMVHKDISKKLSAIIFIIVVILGVASGYTTNFLRKNSLKNDLLKFSNEFLVSNNLTHSTKLETVASLPNGPTMAPSKWNLIFRDDKINLYESKFNQTLNSDSARFKKLEAKYIGLTPEQTFSYDELFEPITYGRGIASGDIDRDGFADIVYATKNGPQIFINNRNGTFRKLKLNSAFEKYNTILVSLVDTKNSGFLDLIFSTLEHGPLILENDQKYFQTMTEVNLKSLPHPHNSITTSMSFSDTRKTGRLDFFLGNFFFGYLQTLPNESATNYLIHNNKEGFSHQVIGDKLGSSTLTSIFTSFDNFSTPHLFSSNDFNVADEFFSLSANRNEKISSKNFGITKTPTETMSIDSGDINNDGILDFYITGNSDTVSHPLIDGCNKLSNLEDQNHCQSLAKHNALDSNINSTEAVFSTCRHITDNQKNYLDCLSNGMSYLSVNLGEEDICKSIPTNYKVAKFNCTRFNYYLKNLPNNSEIKKSLFKSSFYRNNTKDNQIETGNVLYVSENNGYTEKAKSANIADTGWSWNSKFADLDNDGWLDIYASNGYIDADDKSLNKFFFHNNKDSTFTDRTNEFNLNDPLPFSAYTYVDINNSGNLSILTNASIGVPLAFINQGGNEKAIEFEIEDFNGNRNGIGTRIKITYGENDKLHQIRELKAGGGFLSFDHPIIHFGLGQNTEVSSVEVFWANGGKSKISKKLFGGNKYKIRRN